MKLRSEPLAPENEAEWDRFCETSDRCWFWHTAAWQHYTAMYESDPTPAFLTRDEHGRVVGIAPRSAAPPAVATDLSRSRRSEVFGSMLADLGGRSFRSSPLHITDDLLLVRREIVVGVAFHQLIQLRDPSDLWADIRKGHRSDIRRAERELTVVQIPGDGPADIRGFQDLHLKAAGRVTRAQGTWELMERWLTLGVARLFLAKRSDGHLVAAAYVYLFKDGAYYGSAANDPEYAGRMPAGHLLQWRILNWLLQPGSPYHHYDIGDQPPAITASEKELAIAAFKRGFGGSTVLVPTFRVVESGSG